MAALVGSSTPATAWCPNCGDTHLRADGKCERCGSGAVRAATHESIEDRRLRTIDGSRTAELKSAEPVLLPASRGATSWLEQTMALLEGLKRERAAAEAQVRAESEKVARYDSAIGVLQAILKRIQVQAPESVAQPRLTRRRPAGRPWATTRDGQSYPACRTCGRSDRQHKAGGYCMTCYRKPPAEGAP